jgi:hypothetical protein
MLSSYTSVHLPSVFYPVIIESSKVFQVFLIDDIHWHSACLDLSKMARHTSHRLPESHLPEMT